MDTPTASSASHAAVDCTQSRLKAVVRVILTPKSRWLTVSDWLAGQYGGQSVNR